MLRKAWWLLLVFAQDDEPYELRRKVFDRAAERLTRAAEALERLKDAEAAQLAWALSGTFARSPDEADKRALALSGTAPFRSNPIALVEAAREVAPALKELAPLRERAFLESARGLVDHVEEALSTLCRINDYRSIARLTPVGLSREATMGCMLHARYMEVSRDFGAGESKSSSEYTPEGARAGKASLIASGAAPIDAVDRHFSCFYARVPLLNPGLKRVGIGVWPGRKGWSVVIDVESQVEEKDGLVVYPVAGQKGVPREMGTGDRPDALPDGAKAAGQPVTVSAFGGIWEQIREKTDIVARLEDAWGKAVPCFVSTPADPANRTRPDNARSVCLIPREPLKKKALYRAYFEIPLEAGRKKLETYFVTQGD